LPEKVVRVELKSDKMAQMHIPLEAVLGTIQSEAVNIPAAVLMQVIKLLIFKRA